MNYSQRLAITLQTVFGGVALIPAAVGLYGAMSYTVSQSTARTRAADGSWCQRSGFAALGNIARFNSGHRGSCSRSHSSRSVNVINGQTSLPGQPIRSDDIRIRLRSHDCGCDDGLFLACLARYSNRSGERFAKLVFKAPRNKNCGGNCKESTPAPTPVDGI